jgi:integrase/recombinase XerC
MLKDKFIQYIQFEKRFSDNTFKAYSEDLDQFERYLLSVYGLNCIEEADHNIIRSWLIQLLDDKCSTRTINRKLSTLKSFFKFLIRNGYLAINPLNKVISPKTSKRLPVFIDKDKMNELFTRADFGEGFEGVRNRLIMLYFYASGIRVSELSGLKISDIDLNNGVFTVLGKRNKERMIPIGRSLCEDTESYLHDRDELINTSNIQNNNDYLFVTKKGKQVSRFVIYSIVTSIISQVSTQEKRSPHVLRHTFATHMLDNGADLSAIKELLGHTSLAATQVYTHNSISKLKSVYNQAHPRA